MLLCLTDQAFVPTVTPTDSISPYLHCLLTDGRVGVQKAMDHMREDLSVDSGFVQELDEMFHLADKMAAASPKRSGLALMSPHAFANK